MKNEVKHTAHAGTLVRILYGIRTKVPAKGHIQNSAPGYYRSKYKALQRNEKGNNRGRSMPKPHPSSAEYLTIHGSIIIHGSAQR